MSYFFLSLGIVCEIASLIALKETHGFTRPLPVALFAIGLGISFYFESLALRTLPIGMTYAVWAGVGIVGMAIIGATFYDEAVNGGIILGLALIVAGVFVMFFWAPGEEAHLQATGQLASADPKPLQGAH